MSNRHSIQFRLSLWLLSAILAVACLAGLFSYRAAYREAHAFQDQGLRQVAALFERQKPAAPASADADPWHGWDEETRLIVQRLDVRPAGGAGGTLPLSPALSDGLHTVMAGGEPFRVVIRTAASGERVAVAQETGFRDEIARRSALRAVTPFLVLIPVLLFAVATLVRGMFRPIARLAAEIDRRTDSDLAPVPDAALPLEVRPFVVAINRMLERVARAMDLQRRFVADAAHELRSPMTALSLQVERLAAVEMSPVAQERLGTLRQGLQRNQALLEQLLTLTRMQTASPAPAAPTSVLTVTRAVLEDLMPLADAKALDLGIEESGDARLLVREFDLTLLIRNLVDNAIRYTPAGGRVDLRCDCRAQGVFLQVRDTGPGIPQPERERVFRPFTRILGAGETGSGLGLSIVQAITQRLGADIELGDAAPGLCVTVHFPPSCVASEGPAVACISLSGG